MGQRRGPFFPLSSVSLSLCHFSLQSDMSGCCPQIVPTPGAEAYSFPAHTNMTITIDVHVTFADNSIPVSHCFELVSCFLLTTVPH